KIDFRKDFLGQIGPRMVLFVAPDKSAAVAPGSFETNWLRGFDPKAGIPTAALSHLPKMTLLAEVHDPKTFVRTLEGAINALNHQLAAKAAEMAEKPETATTQPEAGGAPGAPGAGRAGGMRPGGGPGGQRGSSTRRRSASNPAPRFQAMLGSGSAAATASATAAAYILQTPSDSPLKLGPPNFRPVIKFDDKYLAISVGADSADAALKAAKQKGWKPSEDLLKASEHLPPKMVMLGVGDPREVMPAFLASLPGTLQTIINSVITMARAQAANAQQGGANPSAAGPGQGPGGPGGSEMM